MKESHIYLIYTVVLVFLLSSCQNSVQKTKPSLRSVVRTSQIEKENLSIRIDKSAYQLLVLDGKDVVRAYPVVFGANPVQDKLMEGDRSTPEGQFKVRDFYPHKSWSKFIWIDYPTADSWEKHEQAKSENRIPQEATIGGEIGIHGVPPNKANLISERINWTWGCIALTNDDVNDLYEVVYKGMAIEIVK